MNKRYTISGLEHMVRLLSQKPELMALSSMAPLQYVAAKAREASKKCGCNAAEVYNEHRGTFELALNNLGNGDHITMKRILNVDEICYYVKDSEGRLSLKHI